MDAVVFDLYGTLIPNVPPQAFHAEVDRLVTLLGAERPALLERLLEQFPLRMEGKIPDGPRQFAPLAEALGIEVSDAALEEAHRAWRGLFDEYFVLRPDALSTLASLRALGLRIGLATDCSSATPELVERSGLATLLDAAAYSSDLGVQKPDPRMYEHVLEGLGVPGDRCVYVGDGNSYELPGAKRHGMTTVWLDNGAAQHWHTKFDPDGDHTVTALSEVVPLVEDLRRGS